MAPGAFKCRVRLGAQRRAPQEFGVRHAVLLIVDMKGSCVFGKLTPCRLSAALSRGRYLLGWKPVHADTKFIELHGETEAAVYVCCSLQHYGSLV